jgi:hypothetical protein
MEMSNLQHTTRSAAYSMHLRKVKQQYNVQHSAIGQSGMARCAVDRHCAARAVRRRVRVPAQLCQPRPYERALQVIAL